MTGLHLCNFLYLLHYCTNYYQSRGLPLVLRPCRYFYKTVRGRACYQTVRRIFWLQDSTGTQAHANKLYGGFSISDFVGYCKFFPTTRLYGAHYQTVQRAGFEFGRLLPILLLPDCTGSNTLMMAAFFRIEKDPFSIIVYTYYTLAFTAN